MLARYRALPPAVRGWVPYVGVAAGMGLTLFVLGAAVGAESTDSAIIPVREPGSPAPDLTVLGLFAHNAAIAVRSALGLLTLGVYTTHVQVINGFVIGAAWADAAAALGWGRATLSLAPHGALEIPALWLSGAVGFRWLYTVWAIATGDRDRMPAPRLALESLLVTALVLCLLALAAVLEATVSVHLV